MGGRTPNMLLVVPRNVYQCLMGHSGTGPICVSAVQCRCGKGLGGYETVKVARKIKEII